MARNSWRRLPSASAPAPRGFLGVRLWKETRGLPHPPRSHAVFDAPPRRSLRTWGLTRAQHYMEPRWGYPGKGLALRMSKEKSAQFQGYDPASFHAEPHLTPPPGTSLTPKQPDLTPQANPTGTPHKKCAFMLQLPCPARSCLCLHISKNRPINS